MRERRTWLLQINRIHHEQRQLRYNEFKEHAEIMASLQNRETG